MKPALRTRALRTPVLFAVMAALLAAVGFGQSWVVSLSILNLCLISAIMALGLNMQWGYAGLLNVGVMGFAALGGLAGVLVSQSPVGEAWSAGGGGLGLALLVVVGTALLIVLLRRLLRKGPLRTAATVALLVAGFFVARIFFDPAVDAIERIDSAKTGYLGGLGLPIILSWAVGGLLAAGAAWLIGKVALGLRSDYFAIATLGIAEIVITVIKNEDWLSRGVKNVTGLDRPVPYEIDLQASPWFLDLVRLVRHRPHRGLQHLRQALLRGALRARPDRGRLARRARAELALGADDARHPRQRGRGRGDGQGRDPAPHADLRARRRGHGHRGRHAHHAGRAVHAGAATSRSASPSWSG